MSKVSLISLGCPKNRVDSENLLGSLGREGIAFTPDPEDADLVLINTCGFIEEAKRESIGEILKLTHLRDEGKKLLVFGCLAERYREELLREIPEIDALWGVGQDEEIVEYCKKMKAIGDRRGAPAGRDVPIAHSPLPLAASSHAYLKIADGCNRGCSFCVIPSLRGPYRSIESERVLRRAEEMIRAGTKEIILVAQDIGSYGREYPDRTLPSLLRDLSSISGDFWIRLLYLYPTAISSELLTVIAEEEKICRYLDIPLQHSEDRILRAMRRAGTRERYREMIREIRERIPDITLRTTFIVGFPGETEEDFEGLKRFVEEMRFDRLGVFPYSREEGTAAYRMKGNVPKQIRERRRDEIMRMQSSISLGKNRLLIGRRFRALIDEVDGGLAIARLASQAPEIDGVVFVRTEPPHFECKAGEFVEVRITGAYDYDLDAIPQKLAESASSSIGRSKSA